MSGDFDFSEVFDLAADLDRVPDELREQSAKVTKRALQNVKDETRATVSGHPTWKRIAHTVNYDMAGNARFSEGEVGYDDEGQGELAGIYEFGSARRAPHPTLIPAAEAEAPRYMEHLGDLAKDWLR